MNKIFLIGRYDSSFQSINDYLSTYFTVQTCADKPSLVKGMLEVSVPDLIVIRLFGLNPEAKKIFDELSSNYPTIPVLCIGTFSEQEEYDAYLKNSQFYGLLRTVSNESLLEKINTILELNAGKQQENKKVRKSVLLVDDNAIQLRSLNELLKNSYDVQMATSGTKAITMISKKCPDIIFLDYEMPVCDGKMTLELIRGIEEAKDVPVVFLTGVSDKAHIEAVLALKPAGYMLKPAKANKIFDTIERILGK